MSICAEVEICEVPGGYRVAVNLPSWFNYKEKIMGMVVMNSDVLESSGVSHKFGLLETSSGMMGIKLTDEQVNVLNALMCGEVIWEGVCSYPGKVPTEESPELLSFITDVDVTTALAV